MLPPNLSTIMVNLKQKGDVKTSEEASLLNELVTLEGKLDNVPGLTKILTSENKITRVVSGEKKVCPCCGRTL